MAASTRDPPARKQDWSGLLRGPLFGLAPDGVFRASALALGAVGSYPTFSPLPVSLAKLRRFKFLWHYPSAGLAAWPPACIPGGLRGIAPCGVRTFLPRLAPGAILRLPKISLSIRQRRRKNKAGKTTDDRNLNRNPNRNLNLGLGPILDYDND